VPALNGLDDDWLDCGFWLLGAVQAATLSAQQTAINRARALTTMAVVPRPVMRQRDRRVMGGMYSKRRPFRLELSSVMAVAADCV
jgi:hypothetical protein